LKVMLKQGMIDEIAEGTQEVAEEASKKPDLKLKLGEIDLTNINIGYDNEGSRLDTGLNLKKLFIEVNEIDLKTQLIDLDNIEIDGLKGQLAFGKFEKQVQEALPKTSVAVKQAQWKFKLNTASFQDIAFKFDDMNSAPVARGMDYKHLDITNFNLEAKNFSYGPEAITGDISKLTVKDKNGLDIKELRTDFAYGSKGASLKGLYLETPYTLIKDQIVVTYPSLEALSTDLASLSIDANLDGSRIGFRDILLFVPTLASTEPFKSNPNAVMNINSRIEGTVGDMRIANLEINGIGTTRIAASGRITGLPDMNKAYFDINVREFRSTSKDLNMFLPKGTLPANIQLPASFAAKASIKGGMTNFNANVNLVSSYGKANVKAKFDQRRKGAEKYDADAELINFDLGSLIKNDSIGRISLKAKVKGTGLDTKTANAVLKAALVKAEFNGYTYRDLNVNGKINNGTFAATAGMEDPNLDFTLEANGGFKGKYPNGKIKLNVDIADLNKLNLHAGPMKLRGNVDADITDANPDNLNGTVSLHHFMFNNGENEFALDSVNVIAVSTPDKNSIVLKSQIANAVIEGKY
ncbi:MAG: translocation/assembly module TamB, partial [Flavobacterium sp.]